MKKYFIDETINFNEDSIRGFIIEIDDNIARLLVPSDIPSDDSNLYEEEISINEKFSATYDDYDRTNISVEDGELIGIEYDKYLKSI